MHYTFLTDGRIRVAAAALAGEGIDAISINGRSIGVLLQAGIDDATVHASTTPSLRLATLAASYWTLAIESAVGLSFLAACFAGRLKAGVVQEAVAAVAGRRDVLLLLFIVTTYFLLPVLPFAMVLCVLGLAQVDRTSTWRTRAYLLGLLVVQLSMIPWPYYAAGFGLVD